MRVASGPALAQADAISSSRPGPPILPQWGIPSAGFLRAVHFKMFNWVEKKGRASLSLSHHLQEHTSLHLRSQELEQRPVSLDDLLTEWLLPMDSGISV